MTVSIQERPQTVVHFQHRKPLYDVTISSPRPFPETPERTSQLSLGLRDVSIAFSVDGHDSDFLERWQRFSFEKADTQLHSSHEFVVSEECYDEFYAHAIGIWWWVHFGMREPFQRDIQGMNLRSQFARYQSQYTRLAQEKAREAMAHYPDADAAFVHEPNYQSPVARLLKDGHRFKGKVVGFLYIPFPAPDDFLMLKEVIGADWERLTRTYLDDWLAFDAVHMFSERDVTNFRDSVAYYTGEVDHLPDLYVTPIGVDVGKIQSIAKGAKSEKDVLGQLEVGQDSQWIGNIAKTALDDLASLSVVFNFGTRVDPCKYVPNIIQAVDAILERNPDLRGRFSYFQQLRRHRQSFPSHRFELSEIRRLTREVNDKYAVDGMNWLPIVLVDRELSFEEVLMFSRLVSSKAARAACIAVGKEGMNRSAQEALYASDRDDLGLILTPENGLGEFLGDRASFLAHDPRRVEDVVSSIMAFLEAPEEELHQKNAAARARLETISRPRAFSRILRSADLEPVTA